MEFRWLGCRRFRKEPGLRCRMNQVHAACVAGNSPKSKMGPQGGELFRPSQHYDRTELPGGITFFRDRANLTAKSRPLSALSHLPVAPPISSPGSLDQRHWGEIISTQNRNTFQACYPRNGTGTIFVPSRVRLCRPGRPQVSSSPSRLILMRSGPQ